MMDLYGRAVAEASRNPRKAAELYREYHTKARKLKHQPGKVSDTMYYYYSLCGYTSFFDYQTPVRLEPTESDIKFLEGLAAKSREKDVPFHHKALAAFIRGILAYDTYDRSTAYQYYKKCVAHTARCNPKALELDPSKMMRGQLGFVALQKLMDDEKSIFKRVVPYLRQMENSAEGKYNPNPPTDSVVTRYVVRYGPYAKFVQDQNKGLTLLELPGFKCDSCGKKSKKSKLSVCSKCKHKFYCSAQCQKMDWKSGGHKRICRVAKDLRKYDLIRLTGPTTGELAQYKGEILEVQENNNCEDHVSLSVIGGSSSTLVPMSSVTRVHFHEERPRYK